MSRFSYITLLVLLLAFKANQVYANEAKVNSVATVERHVIKIASDLSEGTFISIPHAALTKRNGITGVFVLSNKQARFRMVRVGKITTKQLEILSGLFGGEILLIKELDLVHDGSPVIILTKKSMVTQ